MYYLSFDVANKSLAISLIRFNKNYKNDIQNIKNNKETIEYIKQVNVILSNTIEYIYYSVEDLIPNKKIKESTIFERSSSLKEKLRNIKHIINNLNANKIIVLIEYQMSSNYNANAIYNQIIYEFTNCIDCLLEPIYDIHIMHPSYKNKIYFHNDLIHSNFLQKYNNNYIANKNHTKANFIYYLNVFNLTHVLDNIKKKNIDDLADSFIQIFGYIKFYENVS